MIYAVVDIETTGGTSKHSGITEIAVVRTDGTHVLDQWSSLVNPGAPIPPRIVALTGIDDAMVEDAPAFETIADELERLEDATFVAHNVGFDYAFIRGHFEAMGRTWQRPKLCTVRLARKAIPGLPRYGLGALCDALGIEHTNRHRAMGDALATTTLFGQIFATERGQAAIQDALQRGTREHWMPQHVPAKEFDALPNEPGVYWFMDGSGKPLYIGASIQLQQRVRSHFASASTSGKRQTLNRDMRSLKHELAGSEWMAIVMEDVRIRAHWPPLNRAQKQPSVYKNVVHYLDRQGRNRLAVRAQRSPRGAIRTFHSEASARTWLHEQVLSHGLNPAYLGLGNLGGEVPCTDDEHTQRFESAMALWRSTKSGWFVERGRTSGERAWPHSSRGQPRHRMRVCGCIRVARGPLDTVQGCQALAALSQGLSLLPPPRSWTPGLAWNGPPTRHGGMPGRLRIQLTTKPPMPGHGEASNAFENARIRFTESCEGSKGKVGE